jgi:ABC-type transporter Mla subunit MlaD
VVYVAFAGPVEVQTCADVRYQGVSIGDVRSISLRQSHSDQPAQVVLELGIVDQGVTIREADSFTIESEGLFGDFYVAITASPERSPPLAFGATVAGTPPVFTRLTESATSALEWFNNLTEDGKEAFLEALGGRGESAAAPTEPDPP